eukprot:scaffold1878_cov149-Chaetoceros_neogracile.AAC.1
MMCHIDTQRCLSIGGSLFDRNHIVMDKEVFSCIRKSEEQDRYDGQEVFIKADQRLVFKVIIR